MRKFPVTLTLWLVCLPLFAADPLVVQDSSDPFLSHIPLGPITSPLAYVNDAHTALTFDIPTTITSLTATGSLSGNATSADMATTATYATTAGTAVSYTETDPVYGVSEAATITSTDTSNWDTAYGWGDHGGAGYLTTETDPVFSAVDTEAELETHLTDVADVYTNNDGLLTDDDVTSADVQTALSNDFHNIGGVDATDDSVSSGELDGVFSTAGLLKRTGAATYSTITDSSANWDTAYGWGDHGAANYLDLDTYPDADTDSGDDQPLDATLTALSAISGTGLIAETGPDTFAHRSIVAANEDEVIIINGDGVSGNPTIELDPDIARMQDVYDTRRDIVLYYQGGNSLEHFTDLSDAQDSAGSGDRIEVWGNYAETSLLGKSGVTWEFHPGSSVDNVTTAIFGDGGTAKTFEVRGHGSFTSATNVVSTSAASTIRIEGDYAEGTDIICVTGSSVAATITADFDTWLATGSLSYTSTRYSAVHLRGRYAETSSYAIRSTDGDAFCWIDRIVGTGSVALVSTTASGYGWTKVYAYGTQFSNGSNAILATAGTNYDQPYFYGCHFISSASTPIPDTSGAIYGCTLNGRTVTEGDYTSINNGNITLAPHGTGDVVVDGTDWSVSDAGAITCNTVSPDVIWNDSTMGLLFDVVDSSIEVISDYWTVDDGGNAWFAGDVDAGGAVTGASLALSLQPTVRARRVGSNQSIASGSWVTLVYDTEDVDNASIHNNSTGVITIASSGNYSFNATEHLNSFAYAGAEQLNMGIRINGASGTYVTMHYEYMASSQTRAVMLRGSVDYDLAANDTVEFICYQSTGSTLYMSNSSSGRLSHMNIRKNY